MKKRKILTISIVISLFILLGFTATTAIYYWKSVSELQDIYVSIGGNEEAKLFLEVKESFDGKLVPEGRRYWEGEVEEVVFVYELSVDKTLVTTMDLVVHPVNIKIDGESTYKDIVVVEINEQINSAKIDFFNGVVEVTVKIRLLEPLSPHEEEGGVVFDAAKHIRVENAKEVYEAINGKRLELTLKFEILPKN